MDENDEIFADKEMEKAKGPSILFETKQTVKNKKINNNKKKKSSGFTN